jgi:hypothetical protein
MKISPFMAVPLYTPIQYPYNESMLRRPERFNIAYLFAFVTGLSVIGFLVNTVPPTNPAVVTAGVAVFAAAVFFFLAFLTGHVRRSATVAVGVAVWLGLRYLQLRDILYALLLVLLLVSIEYGATKREKEDSDGKTP